MHKYLLPLVLFLFVGCNNSSQPNTQEEASKPESTVIQEDNSSEEKNTSATETLDSVKEQPAAAITETKAAETAKSEPVVKTPPAKVEKAPILPKEPIKPKAEAPKPAVETPKPVSVTTIDGSTLFGQKCASCHGSKAEKSALGKSQIIAGWSVQQIEDALNGYREGTYGKEMKAIMQGQAKGLSHDQQNALAKFISTL